MPIIQSAKKALRQSTRRREKNLVRKEAFKNAIKKYKKSVADKKFDAAKTELSLVFKTLDKAAKANTIHPNKASRLKSRLSQLLKKASS